MCSPDCYPEMKGNCEPNCLNYLCDYDDYGLESGCQDTVAFRLATATQALTHDYTAAFSMEDCIESAPDCTEGAFYDAMSQEICAPDCNTKNCAWSLGFCINMQIDSCTRGFGSQSIDCLECAENYLLVYTSCEEYIPHFCDPSEQIPGICVPRKDVSSIYAPDVIFVAESEEVGLGTSESPFGSLVEALSSVYSSYTVIYLLGPEVSMSTTHKATGVATELLLDPIRPLFGRVFESLVVQSMTCDVNPHPLCSESPTVINVLNPISLNIAQGLYLFKNVVFTTKSAFSEVPGFFYCPFVEQSNNIYQDIRGNQATKDMLDASQICEPFREIAFFNVTEKGTLTLQNVLVDYFTTQMHSFILAEESSVSLINVTFSNFQSNSEKLGFIQTQGGDFEFFDGKVTYMNNNYEYVKRKTAGFFMSSGLTEVTLLRVTFYANLAINPYAYSSISYDSLLNFKNFAKIWIANCTFLNNFATGSFITIESTVALEVSIDESLEVLSHTDAHVTLTNLLFKNNFAETGFIQIAFSQEQRNVEISDCVFQDSGLRFQSYLSVVSTQVPSSEDVSGGNRTEYIESLRKKMSVLFPAKWLHISNLRFERVKSHQYLINVARYANVQISNITASASGDYSSNDIATAMSYYTGQPGIYMSKIPTFAEKVTCSASIALSFTINTNVSAISLTQQQCWGGGVGLACFSCSGSNLLSNISTTDSRSSSKGGLMLYSQGSYSVNIFNVTVLRSTMRLGSMVLLEGLTQATITNSAFRDNAGGLGACISAQGGANLMISSVRFLNNTSVENSAGALAVRVIPGVGMTVSCTGSWFEGNSGVDGGTVYLVSSALAYFTFTLQRCTFLANQASLASAVLKVATNVAFTPSSTIDNCTFLSNQSPTGVIRLAQSAGFLTIINSLFRSNKGTFAGAVLINSEAEAFTYFLKCTFEGNSGQTAISKDSSRLHSSFKTEACVFQGSDKNAVRMEGGKWEDVGSRFVGSGESAIEMSSAAVFAGKGSVFERNKASKFGGTAYLGTFSEFTCESCEFRENSATHGGVFYIEANSKVNISRSLFEGNQGFNTTSTIYFTSCQMAFSAISHSVFRNNVAPVGLIFALNSAFGMDSVDIYNNHGEFLSGVGLLMSTLTVTNSTFRDQSSALGAFLILWTSSAALVQTTAFLRGIGTTAGAIVVMESKLTLSECSFADISAERGGAIQIQSNSYVTLSSVVMVNISSLQGGSAIGAIDSTLFITDSTFFSFSIGGIVGMLMRELRLISSAVSTGKGNAGAGLYCSQCEKILIQDCMFREMFSAQHGAAIGVESGEGVRDGANVTIRNCYFSSNHATEWGGAIYVQNVHLRLEDTVFEDNFSELSGGGVYMSCSTVDFCSFRLSRLTFHNNKAEVSGGALAWNSVKPVLANITTFSNAATYGPDFASFPIKLSLLASNSSASRRLDDNVFAGMPPGQPTGVLLRAGLIDHYGQVFNIDNVSVAELTPKTLGSIAISGITKVNAENGIFTLKSFIIYADPNSTAEVVLSTPTIDQSTKGDPDIHQPRITLHMEMRSCEPGETEVYRSCFICDRGTYGFKPSEPCKACPDNADCLGNVTIYPKSGYWRSGIYSAQIWPCPNPKACLGGTHNEVYNPYGACEVGYTGNMCQSCASNFSSAGRDKCGRCPDKNENVVKLSFIALGAVVMNGIMVSSTLKSATKATALHSIYLKILMNYLQLVVLVTEFRLEWPDPVLQLFSTQQQAGEVVQQAYSFDCLLYESYSHEDAYYYKVAFTAVLPIGLVLVITALWGALALWKHKPVYMSREYAATLVIVFFMIHPNLVKTLFSLFSCREINAGEYWLTADMAIECWNGQHSLYVLALGLPAVILWVFAVPFICLGILVKFRRRLDELWLRMQYGFLLNGFRRSQFYWEFVILYRKIAVICCSVFLANSVTVQALTVQIIIVGFLLLQNEVQPYSLPVLNAMEVRAIIVADLSIYCGLYFLTNNLSTASSWFFFLVIVAANAVFLTYWVWKMLSYFVKAFATSLPVLGKLLYPEAFDRDEFIEECIALFPAEKRLFAPSTAKLYVQMLKITPKTWVSRIKGKKKGLSSIIS